MSKGRVAIGGPTKKFEQKIAQLESENKVLESERMFYFDKLQMVEEVILQNKLEESGLGKAIVAILYAEESEKVDLLPEGQVSIKAADGATKTFVVVE